MVGIDIVRISRIAEAMEKDLFCEKILNKEELEYAFGKSKVITEFGFNSIAMTVAGLFAAKEAILKALKIGMVGGFGFKDITIDHDDKSAPIVTLNSNLSKYLQNIKKNAKIEISIAHDGEYAIAMATIN